MPSHRIRLSKWAKLNGYSYSRALRMFHKGLIEGGVQDPRTKSVFVEVEWQRPGNRALVYVRVPETRYRKFLDSRAQRLREFAESQGLEVVREAREVGSGLRESNPVLERELGYSDKWDVLVLDNLASTTRLGASLVTSWVESDGRRVLEMRPGEGPVGCKRRDMRKALTQLAKHTYTSTPRRGLEAKVDALMEVMEEE